MYQLLSVPPAAPCRVRRLIKDHVDMQFRDVHCMLRLPMPMRGLRAACNFAAANTLLDLIAGASVVLYKPEDFCIEGNRGKLFKELLASCFSWLVSHPDDSPGDAADRLYKVYRSSLAHTFGVLKPGADVYKIVRLKEDGLSETEIVALEHPGGRPG